MLQIKEKRQAARPNNPYTKRTKQNTLTRNESTIHNTPPTKISDFVPKEQTQNNCNNSGNKVLIQQYDNNMKSSPNANVLSSNIYIKRQSPYVSILNLSETVPSHTNCRVNDNRSVQDEDPRFRLRSPQHCIPRNPYLKDKVANSSNEDRNHQKVLLSQADNRALNRIANQEMEGDSRDNFKSKVVTELPKSPHSQSDIKGTKRMIINPYSKCIKISSSCIHDKPESFSELLKSAHDQDSDIHASVKVIVNPYFKVARINSKDYENSSFPCKKFEVPRDHQDPDVQLNRKIVVQPYTTMAIKDINPEIKSVKIRTSWQRQHSQSIDKPHNVEKNITNGSMRNHSNLSTPSSSARKEISSKIFDEYGKGIICEGALSNVAKNAKGKSAIEKEIKDNHASVVSNCTQYNNHSQTQMYQRSNIPCRRKKMTGSPSRSQIGNTTKKSSAHHPQHSHTNPLSQEPHFYRNKKLMPQISFASVRHMVDLHGAVNPRSTNFTCTVKNANSTNMKPIEQKKISRDSENKKISYFPKKNSTSPSSRKEIGKILVGCGKRKISEKKKNAAAHEKGNVDMNFKACVSNTHRDPIYSNSMKFKNEQHHSFSRAKSTLPPLPKTLTYDEKRVQPISDKNRKRLIREADLNDPLQNGWKLFPHQKVGILRALLMRRLILAFDMGLGKTLIGCVWAKAFKNTFSGLKVFIICPVSLKKEWGITMTKVLPNFSFESEKKSKKCKKLPNAIESFEIDICSWAKIPTKVPNSIERYAVIGDEAHNMQSMESTRTKEMLKLVLSKRCEGVLLLTGTPMKNGKPSNLFPLLKAVGHPFGDDQMLYEMHFCNGQQKRFGPNIVWDASGSSNLNLLSSHIASHVFYKTKDDCLKELPKKTREYRSVPTSSRYKLEHLNAMRELANMKSVIDSSENNSREAVLGAFTRVRIISSLAKVDATVALAKFILEEEGSIVIFTCFVMIAKEVRRKLHESGWSGELLVGETPSSKRQDLVNNFQTGISPVFVTTFGAGGCGITLTAACTCLLLDRPWTPGDALQAEDRIRRIGQTRPVTCIWMRAFEVDEQIDNLIEQKEQNSSTVVDGMKGFNSSNRSKNRSEAAPKITLHKLVRLIIGSTKR